MKAIILAAGKGTRLQPLTFETPKPLLLVSGKTILECILGELPESITEVVIVVDYLREQIEQFVSQKKFPFTITCVQQIEDQKGTLAALRSVQPLLTSGEKFLVLNGDDLVERIDLEKMLLHPRSFGAQHTNGLPKYHKVVSKDGILESLEPQTEEEKVQGVPIATGTYYLDTQIFDFAPELLSGNEIGIPQTILKNKNIYPVVVVPFESWVPINALADLEKANNR